MILQLLADYAEREELVADRAFENAGVAWAIEAGTDGQLITLHDLRSQSQGKGHKLIPRQMLVPKRSKRTGQPWAEFLVDKPEYVIGIGEKPERAERRQRLFVQKMAEAAEATGGAECKAAVRFLNDAEAVQKVRAEMTARGFASNDLICFRVAGGYLHEIEALKEYWRNQLPDEGGAQCLVCGKVAPIARLHPNIKGLAGASTNGVPIVSFNKAAFCSYGWEQNANAPVCEDCAAAYTTALNRCLSRRFPDPHDPEATLARQAYTLSENLTAVYWSDDPASRIEETIDRAATDPSMAEEMLKSPYTGGGVTGRHARFHCLLIQGAQGRATIRSYTAATIEEVRCNLRQWFDETSVGLERPLGLYSILSALTIPKKAAKLPPGLCGELYLSVLFGRPIPLYAWTAAVTRNRVECAVTTARAALLQAWRSRTGGDEERRKMVSLTAEFPSVGYQLGRLLALCESIQSRRYWGSGGKANKTVTDRYFAALSTRPKLVLAGLLRLTEAHLSQLGKGGGAIDLKKKLGEVMGRIGPEVLPAHLSLEEQSNFALGFYHQRQANYAKASEGVTPDGEQKNEENGR